MTAMNAALGGLMLIALSACGSAGVARPNPSIPPAVSSWLQGVHDPFRPRTDLVREYPRLRAMVQEVPVPPGVHRKGEPQEYLNDGPGFTSTKFPEVTQKFATSLDCHDLERSWLTALRSAHIAFTIHSISTGTTSSFIVIAIRETPPYLAITPGGAANGCPSPSVEAYTDPS